MKLKLLFCISVFTLLNQISYSQTYPKREFRAAWVSTVWNLDYPSSSGLSVATQQSQFINHITQLRNAGIRVVFIQVRPSCDAFYDSSLEPWSQWLTGAPQNTTPSPYYDPLVFYVNECHKRGMELHAWVNPYRAASNYTSQSFSSTHVTNAHPSWCVTYNTKKFLNPGLAVVRNYVKDVIMEIVQNYDIDGLHFDDYFYPYPEAGFTFNDAAAFSAEPRGFTNLDNWRRDNVNIFINTIHDSIKAVKPWVRFGISPFGIWKSGVPAGITGLSSYFDIYCDPINWLQQGNVDYIMPQLYWLIGGAQDFAALNNWWGTQAQTYNRHCFQGMATYRMETANGNWPVSEIKNQIDLTRSIPSKVQGYGCFSSKSIVTNLKGIRDTLQNNKNKYLSLLPAMTWQNSVAPNLVTGVTHQINPTTVKLSWNLPTAASDGDFANYFVIYRFLNGTPVDLTNPANIVGRTNQDTIAFVDNLTMNPSDQVTYCITSVDRYSNESTPMYYNICNQCDVLPPNTSITGTNSWKTTNFNVNHTDTDVIGGSGVEKGYYNAEYFDGTKWAANTDRGFAFDDFENSIISSQWSIPNGSWATNSGKLQQTDVAISNTNAYLPLSQNLSNRYVYNFRAAIAGTGTNRRAGVHLFVSDPTLNERGNSILVWFRLDDDKIQLYQTAGNVLGSTLQVTDFNFTANQYYDFSIMYDRISGDLRIYIDNNLISSYILASPYSSGDFVSFRSGNSEFKIEEFRVLRSRASTTGITVGSGMSNDLIYQNINPSSSAGRINSFCNDSTYNIGAITSSPVDIDFTSPLFVGLVNDGLGTDVATNNSTTQLSANWSTSTDPNSDVVDYLFGIGSTSGATDILSYQTIGNVTNHTQTGLALTVGSTYYVSVKSINGAGLISDALVSNGQQIVAATTPPVANFNNAAINACVNNPILFTNSSSNADNFQWSFPGGTPSTSTATNPTVIYNISGTYSIELIATGTGGADTIVYPVIIQVDSPSSASFTSSGTTFTLPNAIVTFTNTSSDAITWQWNFGNGITSTDANPFCQYTTAGNYLVTLITNSNGACLSDTATVTIQVGNLGIDSEEISIVYWFQNENVLHVIGDFTDFIGTEAKFMDIQGKILLSQQVTNKENILFDVVTIPAGVYFVRLESSKNSQTRVLIVK
jgi:uncharacterized lipoprotein YddW (UPF0748 family)/PKD repeat protein